MIPLTFEEIRSLAPGRLEVDPGADCSDWYPDRLETR